MATKLAGTETGTVAPCVGSTPISAAFWSGKTSVPFAFRVLLLIRASPRGLNWINFTNVYCAAGAGLPTGYRNGVVQADGLELPMQYVDATFGRVSKVEPVPDGASVCVHRCTLSILVSLPT